MYTVLLRGEGAIDHARGTMARASSQLSIVKHLKTEHHYTVQQTKENYGNYPVI